MSVPVSLINTLVQLPKVSIPNEPLWYQDIRRENRKRFEHLGFPTTKSEEWKHTDIAPIAQRHYQWPQKGILAEKEPFQKYIEDDFPLIVFINGIYTPEYSRIESLPKGVHVSPFKDIFKNNNPRVQKFLTYFETQKEPAFVALNKTLAEDGVFIEVEDKTIFEPIIHILHIVSNAEETIISPLRNLIIVGKNSEITVLESYVCFNEQNIYFTNPLTEIFLGENATLHYSKVQKESQKGYHVGTTRLWQEKNSNFYSFAFSTGGAITRNHLDIALTGEGATSVLNGLFSPYASQLVDNHTCVEHQAANCTSNQLYKGILNESGHGVFNGKIVVWPAAQGTNSYQLNKNILLGKSCLIDTKPQLEIGADDVKCTHGATIGHLNEDELFYLQTRGLSKKMAMKMLVNGFVDDIINTIRSQSIRRKLNLLMRETIEKI